MQWSSIGRTTPKINFVAQIKSKEKYEGKVEKKV